MTHAKIIEFFGMPKAGKSTQIEILETYLKREKRRKVRVVHEGARICPIDKQERFLFHVWSLNNTINKVIEAKQQDFDYILVDRGIIDHIAFGDALFQAKLISKSQKNTLEKYAKEFLKFEDVAFSCVVPPEEAIRREQKYHKSLGRVINMDFLTVLFNSYNNIDKYLENTYHIDCLDKLSSNREAIEKILTKLNLI